ncbi:MAG: hypothetical protein SP1CHLAM54_07880 [Chlamydiia bacterium]|nr:hypothetical protein [Chlamydiia bacterium]MCH9615694.1 hypothetical protein [Chlamydiia bacterium]MCH9628903.1 hypothetical protein [Chlamydiia bacterium]
MGKGRLLELHEQGTRLIGAGKDSVTAEIRAKFTHTQAKVARLWTYIEQHNRRDEWADAAPAPKTTHLSAAVCVEWGRKDPAHLGFTHSFTNPHVAEVDLRELERRLKAKGIGHAWLDLGVGPYLVIRRGSGEAALAVAKDMCDESSGKAMQEVFDTRTGMRRTHIAVATAMNRAASTIAWVG